MIIIIVQQKKIFFFVPKYKPLPFCDNIMPFPVVAILFISAVANRAALSF